MRAPLLCCLGLLTLTLAAGAQDNTAIPTPGAGPPPAGSQDNDAIGQTTETEDPHGLSGLTRLDVAMGETLVQGTASTAGLETQLERRMVNAGLEIRAGDDVPALVLDTHIQRDANAVIYGRVTLSLRQPVKLVRNSQIETTATTWTRTAILLAPDDADTVAFLMQATVENLAGQFLDDYHQINAPRAPQRVAWWSRLWPF